METLVLEISRPETTSAVTRGAGRLMAALGYAPLLEVTLPNGRRADIMALGPRGEIAIAEVKSGLEDFRTDRKWGEYLPFCDLFFFAVAACLFFYPLNREKNQSIANDLAERRKGARVPATAQ